MYLSRIAWKIRKTTSMFAHTCQTGVACTLCLLQLPSVVLNTLNLIFAGDAAGVVAAVTVGDVTFYEPAPPAAEGDPLPPQELSLELAPPAAAAATPAASLEDGAAPASVTETTPVPSTSVDFDAPPISAAPELAPGSAPAEAPGPGSAQGGPALGAAEAAVSGAASTPLAMAAAVVAAVTFAAAFAG